MGRITVIENITLDGVMQAPARPDEDTRGAFPHGGWGVPYQDEVIGRKMAELMAGGNGALLLGRLTYENLFSVWPKRTNNPFTEHLNNVRKYVASRTLDEPPLWQNSTLLKGDAVDAVAELKQITDISVLGSGDLVQSLIRHGLVDEYVLTIFPLVLGTGRRLFAEVSTIRLRLIESLTTTKGVIFARYQPEQG